MKRETNSPMILVVGADGFLVERAFKGELQKLRGRFPDAEVIDCEARETDQYQFVEYSSPSLFSTSSIICIRGLNEADDGLLQAISDFLAQNASGLSDTWILATCDKSVKGKKIEVSQQAAGASIVTVEDLQRDSDRVNFICKEFARFNRHVEPAVTQAIAGVMSGQTGEIVALVEQLCTDFDTDPMPMRIAEQYLIGSAQVTGFTIADNALAGKVSQALLALRSAIGQGVSQVAIIGAIAMKLRMVGKAAAVRSGSITYAQAKAPSWQLRTAERQLSGWTSEGLARCVEAVARCDAMAKSSAGDSVYELERAVELIGVKGRVL